MKIGLRAGLACLATSRGACRIRALEPPYVARLDSLPFKRPSSSIGTLAPAAPDGNVNRAPVFARRSTPPIRVSDIIRTGRTARTRFLRRICLQPHAGLGSVIGSSIRYRVYHLWD